MHGNTYRTLGIILECLLSNKLICAKSPRCDICSSLLVFKFIRYGGPEFW